MLIVKFAVMILLQSIQKILLFCFVLFCFVLFLKIFHLIFRTPFISKVTPNP